MNILIIGAGVMAHHTKESILSNNHNCVGMIDPMGNGDFKNFIELDNIDIDAIIDFSHFSLLEDILLFAKKRHLPLLIATTGHSDDMIKMIKEYSKYISIVKATNTSFGVNIMNMIVDYAASLLDGFDIEIVEKHHTRKLDAPSGTAKTLKNIIEKNRKVNEIHSIRLGNIVGEHTVLFSKNDEIIEIKHEALSRKIFSDGAIKVVEYLVNKDNGLYEMKDILRR